MKIIRNPVTMAGLSVVFFVLGATGARAQSLSTTNFAGTFTLPFEARWGMMTLPAGDYTLHYDMQETGRHHVFVRGTAKGSPYGMILARPVGEASLAQSAIVCIRYGNTLIVHALEMPTIGQSVLFGVPRSTKLVTRNGKHGRYTQLAEAPNLLQRIPVTLNAK